MSGSGARIDRIPTRVPRGRFAPPPTTEPKVFNSDRWARAWHKLNDNFLEFNDGGVTAREQELEELVHRGYGN
jgi:hypothetical protein